SVFNTTLYFVCPNTSVTNTPASSTAGVFPTGNGFPVLLDASGNAVQPSLTPLFLTAYSVHERFLRDFTPTCTCLTAQPPGGATPLNPIYSAPEAADGTYTEVQGNLITSPQPAVCDFTVPVKQVAQPVTKAAPDCGVFVSQTPDPIPPGCPVGPCNVFNT